MQLGVRNEEAAAAAAAAHLKVVMNPLSENRVWAPFGRNRLGRRKREVPFSSKRPLLGQRGVQNHVLAGRR